MSGASKDRKRHMGKQIILSPTFSPSELLPFEHCLLFSHITTLAGTMRISWNNQIIEVCTPPSTPPPTKLMIWSNWFIESQMMAEEAPCKDTALFSSPLWPVSVCLFTQTGSSFTPIFSTREALHNEVGRCSSEGAVDGRLSIRSCSVTEQAVLSWPGGMSASSVRRHAGHPLSESQGLFPSSPW